MAVSAQQLTRDRQTDQCPLLIEQSDGNINQELIIYIERGSDASLDSLNLELSHSLNPSCPEGRPGNGTAVSVDRSSFPSPSRTNSRSSTFRSPFNSGFWISIELGFTLSQIVASIIVLCLSRHEHPQAPLLLVLLAIQLVALHASLSYTGIIFIVKRL